MIDINLIRTNKELVKEINAKKTKINIVNDSIYYLDSSKNPSQAYQIYRVGTSRKKQQGTRLQKRN